MADTKRERHHTMTSKTTGIAAPDRKTFQLILIRPSHYDRDGYVIRWLRSVVPSNTLATLYGLARDCAERQVLGPDIKLAITALDESNTRIRVEELAGLIKGSAGGLIGLVGVQSNQYPRAMDLARRFRDAGVPVCIGGFHVSGLLSMLPGIQPDLQEAMDLGISLFAGEAEGRLDEVLRDAHAGTMKPLYNYINDLPELGGAPIPFLPAERVMRTVGRQASFDAGRGCPFQCSFCTIINVQGRRSRRRTADDVEKIVRANLAQDIRHFFITDDNFARNKDWEAIFDRLIALREGEGHNITLTIQVDTLCHQIPGFIEKAGRAGVNKVFIGLESINPESLACASKKQNRISEYRAMLQAWRRQGVLTFAGYILGFPGDTPETIARDLKIIQRELPIDILEFFILMPLPGSADHKRMFEDGVWIDPDLNKLDSTHVTMAHPRMSAEEWEQAYRSAWTTYYSPEHAETLFRRAVASGIRPRKMARTLLWFLGCSTIEHVHPLDGGYFRLKYRDDRRPGLKRESPWVFYPRYGWEIVAKHARFIKLIWFYRRLARQAVRDARGGTYEDPALTPVAAGDGALRDLLNAPKPALAAARETGT